MLAATAERRRHDYRPLRLVAVGVPRSPSPGLTRA